MKALRKDFIREIRHTFSRFLSILILVALAVAFLSGLRSTAPDMKNTCDSYLDDQSFMDIQILGSLGITAEDIEVLRAQPGIETVEPAYVIDAYTHTETLDLVTKLYSLPRELNQVTVLEGRMPQSASECVVDKLLLDRMGLELGDQLEFQTSGDFEDVLLPAAFTVVGVVRSPLYISPERGTSTLGTGQVAAFAYVPEDAFDLDFYTTAYLTVEGAAETMAFSPAYSDSVDAVLDQLEPIGKERAKLRRESLVDEGNEKLADAQAELDEAKADAEKELTDAWNKLSDARQELDDGWAELKDAKQTLATETADGKQQIADAETELADALVKLQDGETEYQNGLSEYQDGLAKYQDGLAEYEDGLAEFQDGKDEYEDGLREYRINKNRVDNGWNEYYAGLQELHAGEAQLAQAKEQLDAAKAQISAMVGGDPAAADKLLAEGSDTSKPIHTAIDTLLNSARGLIQASEGIQQIDQGLRGIQTQQLPALKGSYARLQGSVNALPDTVPEKTELLAGLAEVSAKLSVIENTLHSTIDQARTLLEEPESPESADLAALQADVFKLQATVDAMTDTTNPNSTTSVLVLAAKRQGIINTVKAGNPSLDNADAIHTAAKAAKAQLAQLPAGIKDAEGLRLALEEGQAQYQAGQQLLITSKAKLDDAYDTLTDAERQLKKGKDQLDDAKQQLDEAEAELNDAKDQLDDAKRELDDAKRQLVDARTDLDNGWQEYHSGITELEDAKVELETKVTDANIEIADAERELQKGEREYQDGYTEYLDGKAEAEEKIADAEHKIGDARRKIADIGDSEWYILNRDTNPGYLGFGQDADRMANLASVFPVLFFLVAALVCLTTMTRMVEEQRVQIGSLKALGYSRWAISRKYLGYGFLPSLLGGILGLAIGFTLFPKMIFTAYQIMYEVPDIQLSIYPGISIASLLAAIACTTVSSAAACMNALRETPAALMRPRAPKAGKRVLLEYIKPLWKRMSFNHKVTARNLLRYQKRFWMTVIGIGGCTALIIAGFGLRSSLLATMSIQYDEIFNYTAQAAVSENLLDSEREAIETYIAGNDDILDSLSCRIGNVTAESQTYNTSAYMEVVDPSRINDFVQLQTYRGQEPLTVPDDGVIIDQKLSELLDIGPGDTFILDGEERVEVRVSAVNENYLGHFIYLSPAYYEEVFGKELLDNAYLMRFTSSDMELCDSIFTDLMNLHGVVAASRMLTTRDTYMSAMERIDFVVVIVILSAAALALVVLYNLSNINITERRRELATIRVLGFYDREVSAYVNRENLVLTFFGILFGIVAGRFLHVWLVRSVEIDLMMFGRKTDPMAFLWAALLTAVFSAVVAWMSHQKMKRIDMVESLKSAE